MRPKNIFLIRHGESQGNVDKTIYKTVPDYAIHLTDVGRQQSNLVGKGQKNLIGVDTVKFYTSPYWRTRETYLEIVKYFSPNQLSTTYEDPRLRDHRQLRLAA